jgi:hypothetical protein
VLDIQRVEKMLVKVILVDHLFAIITARPLLLELLVGALAVHYQDIQEYIPAQLMS